MVVFLFEFLFMLLSGSIFILGFFTITRGKIVILPNGNKTEEKEFLGSWQLFWEQVEFDKKVFYEKEQLEWKVKILEQMKPAYMGTIEIAKGGNSLIFKDKLEEWEIRDMEFTLNCNVFRNDEYIFLYDKLPQYRFPEWARKITNCYVCLSSIGGSLWYWLFIFKYPNFIAGTTTRLTFWVIFCISLSFVNKVIKENLDNDKK